eukprot:12298739-Ditylum_brightwellii.AAC.1
MATFGAGYAGGRSNMTTPGAGCKTLCKGTIGASVISCESATCCTNIFTHRECCKGVHTGGV